MPLYETNMVKKKMYTNRVISVFVWVEGGFELAM